MKLNRHPRWHWLILGTIRGNVIPTGAYIMDDFGTLVLCSYKVSRISMRAGDA